MNVIREISTAGNRLVYRLTEDELDDGARRYGVSVSTTLFGKLEEAAVTDISSCRSDAERFLLLAADNSVLPSTLCEIAEEYVAACYTV